jgi:NAD(P)-dependent dehydrogenase (short-subunit alcohol dehydrogenase family)
MTTYLEDLFSLKGQTALVAGGAGAIGREISIALAQAGATVIVHDLSQDRLDEVSELFANRGFDFMGMQMDLSTEEAATELVNDAVLQTGRIDILVNLQGANRRKPINEVTQEDFDLITSVNMRSVFFMSKAVHRVVGGSCTSALSLLMFLSTRSRSMRLPRPQSRRLHGVRRTNGLLTESKLTPSSRVS